MKESMNTQQPPCCTEDGHTKAYKAKTSPSCHMSTSKPLRLKCSCHTLLVVIKREASKKSSAQLLNVSWTLSWWRVETVVRNKMPSEQWSKPWKSSTSWQEKILYKFLLMPFQTVVPEKTLPELVPVVSLEDKQSMFLQSEELTRPCTSSPEVQESQVSEHWRPSVNAWLMRSSTAQRLETVMPSERRTKSKELPRVTDDLSFLKLS